MDKNTYLGGEPLVWFSLIGGAIGLCIMLWQALQRAWRKVFRRKAAKREKRDIANELLR